MLKTVLKMKKRTDKKEWTGVQEAKGMPKSHSTLEREESDPRKRNSEPEGFLLIHRVAMEQGHHSSEETNHQDEFISKARQCQRVGHYSFASHLSGASLVVQTVKNLPAMQETRV